MNTGATSSEDGDEPVEVGIGENQSMENPITTIQNKTIRFWIRINLAVEIFLKKALLCFLHNAYKDPSYTGLTTDKAKLYLHMVQLKKEKEQQLQRVVRPKQWNVLCPPGGSKLSCSDDWDITLICVVAINTKGLPAPKGGWNTKSPDPKDLSKAASVLRGRELRNLIKHGSLSDISTKKQFETYWTELEGIVRILLSSPQDLKAFKDFKTDEGLVGMETRADTLVSERIKDIGTEKMKSSSDTQTRKTDKLLDELKKIKAVTEEWKSQVLDAVAHKLETIKNGSSLLNTNLTGIQAPLFTVRCSIAVENFTKWPLLFQECRVIRGSVNIPPRTVLPGTREGMAVHKIYGSLFGCWIKCLYIVNGRFFHFTVYQPYSQNKASNQIAIAVTESSCLSADCLLECRVEEGGAAAKGTSSVILKDEKIDLCISGILGTAPKCQATIKVFPRDYQDLSTVYKQQQTVQKDSYHAFIGVKIMKGFSSSSESESSCDEQICGEKRAPTSSTTPTNASSATANSRTAARNKKKKKGDGMVERHVGDKNKELLNKTDKASGGFVLGCLRLGTSLQSSSLRSLQNKSVSIACSGSINNYTKWQLVHMAECTSVIAGYTNCHFQDVAPGTSEGFASHSRKYFPRGSHLKVTYSIDNNGNFLHFIYCLPHDYGFATNYLAIATSKQRDESVNDIMKSASGGDDVYSEIATPTAARFMTGSYRAFYNTVEPVCHYAEGEGICVVGTMGTSHVTELNLKIFPVHFRQLAEQVKKRTSKKEYEDFVKKLSVTDTNLIHGSAMDNFGCI